MVDARTFWIGAFMTLWVVMFFCVSAYELFKTRPDALENPRRAGQARAATRPLKNVMSKDGAVAPSAVRGSGSGKSSALEVLGSVHGKRAAGDFSIARVGRGRGATRARGSA